MSIKFDLKLKRMLNRKRHNKIVIIIFLNKELTFLEGAE